MKNLPKFLWFFFWKMRNDKNTWKLQPFYGRKKLWKKFLKNHLFLTHLQDISQTVWHISRLSRNVQENWKRKKKEKSWEQFIQQWNHKNSLLGREGVSTSFVFYGKLWNFETLPIKNYRFTQKQWKIMENESLPCLVRPKSQESREYNAPIRNTPD